MIVQVISNVSKDIHIFIIYKNFSFQLNHLALSVNYPHHKINLYENMILYGLYLVCLLDLHITFLAAGVLIQIAYSGNRVLVGHMKTLKRHFIN